MVGSSQLTPIARKTITDEIVSRLIGFILDEGLRPGDKLPSERDLVGRLDVGRSSLREAIKTLSALGVVEISVGAGMFVGRGQSSILTKPLAWGLLIGEHSARDVIEARRVVEVEMAALAAARATDDEIATIVARTDDMRANLNDVDAYSRCDQEFHLAVGRAAHNQVLFHVLDTLRHVVRVWIYETFADYPDKAQSLNEHLPITEAICARDPEGARAAMAAHLDIAAARFLAVMSARQEFVDSRNGDV